jgi:hypothetical protein
MGFEMKKFWNAGVAVLGAVVGMATLASPAIADRASLIPYVFRACENQMLSHPELLRGNILLGITTEEVCKCQTSLFISALSEMEVAQMSGAALNADPRLQMALGICGLQSLSRVGR